MVCGLSDRGYCSSFVSSHIRPSGVGILLVGGTRLVELHVLLDAEGVLLLERGEVSEGHQWACVPEVILECFWISGLAQPLDGI